MPYMSRTHDNKALKRDKVPRSESGTRKYADLFFSSRSGRSKDARKYSVQERGGYCMSTSLKSAATAPNPRTFRRSLLSL